MVVVGVGYVNESAVDQHAAVVELRSGWGTDPAVHLDQRADIAAERPCCRGDQPGECQHCGHPEQQRTLAALPGKVELVEVNPSELP